MIVIPPRDFTTMPWKNGGGVTHEIIKREAAGKMLWRFSVADVTSDGPFSRFEGLDRILTVIEGAGLMLAAPQGWLQALPFEPVAFSGSWPITSTRLGGNVQDFNLIYDPAIIAANVSMERGILELEAQPASLFHAVLLTGAGVLQHHEPVVADSFILLEEGTCRIESNAPMLHATCRAIAAT
ncbi:HutD/Ves family protein [Aestuariivirga litoralis]|uniref:HutD/Ves family protein n=1 Tax=Aestuariivirga litoralis TaxID=2650924 RepID=UPI0018C614A2|nr:HutD family protein [Aestuariivirga litoralis]MBG1232657.1 HutD family protein [Aestuariivirga litoralis]